MITIKPIKNDRDHRQALERIDALMNAKKGSKEGDALDVLVTLVEAYEEKCCSLLSPMVRKSRVF